jgi:hypothetical protein
MVWVDYVVQKQRPCLRKSPRKRDYAAALLIRDNHSQPVNCLIRDVSSSGAQVRLSAAQSVPEPGYLVSLKYRTVYHTHAVWRRGSLTGLSFDQQYRIEDELPSHLQFLQRLLVEVLLNYPASQVPGIGKVAQ